MTEERAPKAAKSQEQKEQAAREKELKRQADMVAAVEAANKKPVPGSEEE